MSITTDQEPEFYPDWYDLDIASQNEEGEPVGNEAYMDWMTRVLNAATGGRKIDWTQVELAIILDRQVIRDEARRAAAAGHAQPDDPAPDLYVRWSDDSAERA